MTITRNLYRTTSARRGYIALMSVIALSAIGLFITVGILAESVTSSKLHLLTLYKNQARTAATSCAEEALQLILDTGVDSATGGLSVGSSTCTYTILFNGATGNIEVQSTGQMGSSTTRIAISLASSTPRIKLSSWREVEGF